MTNIRVTAPHVIDLLLRAASPRRNEPPCCSCGNPFAHPIFWPDGQERACWDCTDMYTMVIGRHA